MIFFFWCVGVVLPSGGMGFSYSFQRAIIFNLPNDIVLRAKA
jgi:hypothetical protein